MTDLPTLSHDVIIPTDVMSDNTILGAGDTILHKNFVSKEESADIFDELMKTVDFQQWYHMPSNKDEKPLKPLQRIKRIMVNPDAQGDIPYYRFTVNDQFGHGFISPMPTVIDGLCQRINNFLNSELNHVVILLYRDGSDHIGFHKDKTLDLDENAPIVSISLGCTRTYCLQDAPRDPKVHQEVELESGTLLILGPKTNENYYHCIKPSEDHTTGPRISITFRKAVTYRSADGTIKGKGGQYQTVNWPEQLRGKHVIGYHV